MRRLCLVVYTLEQVACALAGVVFTQSCTAAETSVTHPRVQHNVHSANLITGKR
jgi:hypothetical protein